MTSDRERAPENHDGTSLDELIEPLSAADSPEPLAEGAVLSSARGEINILSHRGSSGGLNHYAAELDGDGTELHVCEAADSAAIAGLQQQSAALADAKCALFPQVIDTFEQDGRHYLAVEATNGETLAETLKRQPRDFGAALRIITQAAFALTRLHSAGWAHLGLKPASVAVGRPVKVTGLGRATRIGEARGGPFYLAGYSAPELLEDGTTDARSDIYSIGALLFHAGTGRAIPETGPELSAFGGDNAIPGLPQLLHRCLGPIQERYASMEDLHRDLIGLARRLVPRACHAVSAATTIGLEPTRTTNQDAHGFLSGKLEGDAEAASWTVTVVADGMGGMAAGEVASAVAVRSILADAASVFGSTGNDITAESQASMPLQWIAKANGEVHRALEQRGAKGGCTIVCACIVNYRLTIGHVGDCRIYLFRDNQATLLTRDHSLVMGRVIQGELDISEVRTHPDRSNVTRSLGERKSLPDYYIDDLTVMSNSATLDLKPGDVLLLATDGLWEPVLDDEMLAAIKDNAGRCESSARDLIELTLRRGAHDNATVVLFHVS